MEPHKIHVLDSGELDYNWMICPHCGFDYIHVDDVFVAGRPREDGDVHPVHVDHRGFVNQDGSAVVPGHSGRRHTITITGWCEDCSTRFAIVFRQHKGRTELATLTQAWSVYNPPPG